MSRSPGCGFRGDFYLTLWLFFIIQIIHEEHTFSIIRNKGAKDMLNTTKRLHLFRLHYKPK